MFILVKFYLLMLLTAFQIEGNYVSHKQICTSINAIDIKWSLDIKQNNTFLLQITKQTNEFLSKPKTTTILGTWQASDNTLQLNQWGKKDNILLFYSKDDKLFLKRSKDMRVNSDFLFFEYFTKDSQ